MKAERTAEALLKMLYLDAAAILVAQALGLDGPVRLLFTLTFPLTVLLWLRSVRERLTAQDLLVLLTVGLAAAHMLLDALISGVTLQFSYCKKPILFWMSILYFQTACRHRVSGDTARFLKRLGDGAVVWFAVMYLLRNERMFYIGEQPSGYLTFGFTNPNLAAMVLCCLYMLQVCRLFEPMEGKKKLSHGILAAVAAWFLWQTRSRNCMLAAAVFTAACVFVGFRGRSRWRIPGWLAALVSILPGLFVAGYLAVTSLEPVPGFLSWLVGEGKRLDSRMAVWGPALAALRDSPVIGAYCRISDGTGVSQMHNSHLDIAASYGVPVLALVCLLLGTYLHQGGRDYSKARFCAMLAFACGLLMGLGEAAVFSGGLGIHLFVGMFLLLANEEEAVS